MIDTTDLSDTIEMKIESEMHDLMDDMSYFKDIVFNVIYSLKNQDAKSMTDTRLCPNQDNTEVFQSTETLEPAETAATARDNEPMERTVTETGGHQQSADSRAYRALKEIL